MDCVFQLLGKAKAPTKTVSNASTRLLTVIRGSEILVVAKHTREGFRDTVSGAFLFTACYLCVCCAIVPASAEASALPGIQPNLVS